jgi:2-oxoglutarate dehydrogenase E2 component (dihydrolipoamide succinyltransferase)
MSVTVSMPQLGESVTEGTVTRWLKKEGERVEADEPLLEVSTDKVDTEIPSPASGVLRGITVAEDETVAVGAQLAIIEEGAEGAASEPDAEPAQQAGGHPYPQPEQQVPAQQAAPQQAPPQPDYGTPAPPEYPQAPAYQSPAASYAPAQPAAAPGYAQQQYQPAPGQAYQAAAAETQVPPSGYGVRQEQAPAPVQAPPPPPAAPAAAADVAPPAAAPNASGAGAAEGPYVTPLVRKLAAEHQVSLADVSGTGVGGRIRKQDVIEAAKALREQQASAAAQRDGAAHAVAPGTQVPAVDGQARAAAPVAAAAPARNIEPSSLRGTTERMSRARQLIARRMVESLQTSAQLTTVVEADVTAIARLRQRAKADFESREGVKLSFLPFFALAAVEALKVHPTLNAVLDTEAGQIVYHDAEHLGIAVDTERGLMVPVIRNAGDLNIGGLARKIADLAARTRGGQVGPDELAGGTFTVTNTGSRGALFDTPIINQPQVGILGTGTVVKRPVVMEDPALGEVITVRSMVYLALTYDHRLVDGADAARYLTTVKDRLQEGAFEAELGL